MRFNIITNTDNGVGLQREYEMLRSLLAGWGHQVQGVHFQRPENIEPADVNLWDEVLVPDLMRWGRENWMAPNPEWWFGDLWDKHLPQIDKVLCKTRDAERIFREKCGDSSSPTAPQNDKAVYLGWKSRDLYDASIPRQRKFLHVAGKSQTKNTAAVLAGWKKIQHRRDAESAELILVSGHYTSALAKVTRHSRVTEEALKRLMNECQFHLMPAGYEGYGHSLHEGLGCGAVMITTDGPSTNDCGAPQELLVPVMARRPMHAAEFCEVSAAGVREAVERALHMTDQQITAEAQRARRVFEGQREEFEGNLQSLIAESEGKY